jgi:hypothetical protein
MNVPKPGDEAAPGMPRWMKVTVIAVAVLALLAVAVMILSGGDHGPGRHLSQPPAPPHARSLAA